MDELALVTPEHLAFVVFSIGIISGILLGQAFSFWKW